MKLTVENVEKAGEDVGKFLRMLDGAARLRDVLVDLQKVLGAVREAEASLAGLRAEIATEKLTLGQVEAAVEAALAAKAEAERQVALLIGGADQKVADAEQLGKSLAAKVAEHDQRVSRDIAGLVERESAVTSAEERLAALKKQLQGQEKELDKREASLNERIGALKAAARAMEG